MVKTYRDSKPGKATTTLPPPVPGGSESVESLGTFVDWLLGDKRARKDAEAFVSSWLASEADQQNGSDSSGGQDAPSPSAPPPPVPGGNESVTKGGNSPGEKR